MKLANAHFWIGTLGILFYAIPLYWAGWTQSLMWKQFTPDGYLAYGNFLETVTQINAYVRSACYSVVRCTIAGYLICLS
jgi:cbb3-type cytochrome oxidase subunit 1